MSFLHDVPASDAIYGRMTFLAKLPAALFEA
jgi:hypothetical protein